MPLTNNHRRRSTILLPLLLLGALCAAPAGGWAQGPDGGGAPQAEATARTPWVDATGSVVPRARAGTNGDKQTGTPAIRHRAIRNAVDRGPLGTAGSFTTPVEFASYAFSDGTTVTLSQFTEGSDYTLTTPYIIGAPEGVESGDAYLSQFVYPGVPDGFSYMLSYGIVGNTNSSAETSRYITLPYDRRLLGFGVSQGGTTTNRLTDVSITFSFVDHQTLPSQATTMYCCNDQVRQFTNTIKVYRLEEDAEVLEFSRHFPANVANQAIWALLWGEPTVIPVPSYIAVVSTLLPTNRFRIEYRLGDFSTNISTIDLIGSPRSFFFWGLVSDPTGERKLASEIIAERYGNGYLPKPPMWIRERALREHLDGRALLMLDLYEACDFDGDGELTEQDLKILESLETSSKTWGGFVTR